MYQTMRDFEETREYYVKVAEATKKVTDRIEKSDPELSEEIKELITELLYLINTVSPSYVRKESIEKEGEKNENR